MPEPFRPAPISFDIATLNEELNLAVQLLPKK